ncbi:MAG: IS21 family transposase [Deltaproteobacteria bacterium]|nr:IS21 family transposase [Deltaproteobacteria bacterium]
MISPEQVAEIRRLFFAEHWPVGTIAAQLGVHPDTVHRALATERFARPAVVRPSQLDPYRAFVQETLQRYPRLRATRLFEMVRQRGYGGSVVQLRRLVRTLRPRPAAEAYLRLNLLPAEQAQVDWGAFGTVQIGHATRPLSAFVMVLSWSRALHALFTVDQTLESFLRGHVEAFAYFQGAPRAVAYDNLRSAVLERRGEAIRFHPRLLELCGHYPFVPRPCAPARANEKGRVERAIRYLRDAFFAARPFRDVADLNAQFAHWRETVAHARRVPGDPDRTVAEALALERARLLPLPEHPFETDLVRAVTSGKTPYVRFDRNLYSIPHTLVGVPLTLVAGPESLRLFHGAAEVACHTRSYDAGFIAENPAHLHDLVAAKRRAAPLTRRDRLQQAVPEVALLFERLALRGEPLGPHATRLLRLLDDYGPAELAAALRLALARDALGAGAVAHCREQRRRARGQRPPVPVVLPNDPRVRDLDVTPHPLESSDGLTRPDDDPDAV